MLKFRKDLFFIMKPFPKSAKKPNYAAGMKEGMEAETAERLKKDRLAKLEKISEMAFLVNEPFQIKIMMEEVLKHLNEKDLALKKEIGKFIPLLKVTTHLSPEQRKTLGRLYTQALRKTTYA